MGTTTEAAAEQPASQTPARDDPEGSHLNDVDQDGSSTNPIRREQEKFLEAAAKDWELVLQAARNRDFGADWKTSRYLGLCQDIAREKLSQFRIAMTTILIGVVAFIAFQIAVVQHFTPTGWTDVAYICGFLGWIVMSLTFVVSSHWLHKRNLKFFTVFVFAWMALFLLAALAIGYGELRQVGPVHSLVGKLHEGNNGFAYMIVHGIVANGITVAAYIVAAPVVAFCDRHYRMKVHPTAKAVRLLFRCLSQTRSEEDFKSVHEQRKLIPMVRELSLILKLGLWRESRPQMLLARESLKQRCALAGELLEMLGVRITLSEKHTYKEFSRTLYELADTLLSGRFGELPNEPVTMMVKSKTRRAVEFARRLFVGAAPLVILAVLQWLKISIPEDLWKGALYVAGAWVFAVIFSKTIDLKSDQGVLFKEIMSSYKPWK
jgi:hypothetical protein